MGQQKSGGLDSLSIFSTFLCQRHGECHSVETGRMEQERKPISQIDSGSGGGFFSALDRAAQSRRANKATKARERAKLCLCEDSFCILREKPVRSHVHKKGERASRIRISPFLRLDFNKMKSKHPGLKEINRVFLINEETSANVSFRRMEEGHIKD